jgi:hypothetical protein
MLERYLLPPFVVNPYTLMLETAGLFEMSVLYGATTQKPFLTIGRVSTCIVFCIIIARDMDCLIFGTEKC